MRIFNEQDIEIQESDVNELLGYTEPDQIFVQHHEAVEAKEREWHYGPKTYYFNDGSQYQVQGEDDPHVEVINLEKCLFNYKTAEEGEEEKVVRGIDVREVETQPRVEAKDAWDEYEDILRYKLYTQEELDEREQARIKEEKQRRFMEEGPDTLSNTVELLDETTVTVDDLVLMMADIIGGAEEEEGEVVE